MKNQYEIDYQQGYDTANDEWIERIDKIRAEIEEHRNKTEHIDKYDLVGDCLDIIDKYRKEK